MARFEFYNSAPETQTEELRRNWRIAGTRVMVALYRLDALLRKFDPNQPRVPAGSGDSSGEWSRVGGGRSATVRKTIGSGLESTEVRIERKPDSRVEIDISPSVGRLHATGTMSSQPGKVTISNFKLTLPGMFNPLSIVSAPTEVTLFDSPGGDLVYEIDKPLTIRAPLVSPIVDVPPGRDIIPDD